MARRLFVPALALVVLAGLASPLFAQVVYPSKPDKYDVQVRYRIRTGREDRIDQFRALDAHLKAIGFAHDDADRFARDMLDASAELATGTLPSGSVAKLFDDPAVKTAILLPAGTKLPDDPNKLVAVRVQIPDGLPAREQRQLHAQVAAQLALLGFVEAVGYDHLKYTQVRGSLPAGTVPKLLKDLRSLPAGWFLGGVSRLDQPAPFRTVLPVRFVEVLPGVPDPVSVAAPTDLGKLTADLKALVADAARKDQPLVVEAVLESEPGNRSREVRHSLREYASGGMVEGMVGTVATVRLPKGSQVVKLAENPEVRTVRLPRPGSETGFVSVLPPGDFLKDSRTERLHALGYTGDGVPVVVIASEFPGVTVKDLGEKDGTKRVEVRIGDAVLPPGSRVYDLSAEVDPLLKPRAADPNRVATGTAAALAAHVAAPNAVLVLVRVDPTALHQLLTVAKAVNGGDVLASAALLSRGEELTTRGDRLAARRRIVLEEVRAAYSDLRDDDEPRKRREAASALLKQLQAEEAEYRGQLDRFVGLRAGLESLRGTRVVVNTLAWDVGQPNDGQGELAKYIAEKFATGAAVSGIKASKAVPPPVWVQAAGTAVGRVWSGPFLDADANRALEFAPADAKLPPKRWTRELNFLRYRTTDGTAAAELPAGLKVRLSVQWREPHNPDVVLPSEPTFPLSIRVLRQIDPAGRAVPSDQLEEVARSAGAAVRLLKTPGSGVYETAVEFTTAAAGVYAVRVEGAAAKLGLPDAARVDMEFRLRLTVETSDPAQAAKGRAEFETFAVDASGVGTPGDSAAAVTVGATGGSSLAGVGPGVTLGVKPDLLTDGSIAVGGKTVSGPAVAAGYVGGLAACLTTAGVRPSDLIRTVGLTPGDYLVLPTAWLDALKPRTKAASDVLGK